LDATDGTDSGTPVSEAETPEKKKPIGYLLGACSGQHPMGYRFSLLTLLFSGVCKGIKHRIPDKLRLIL
jgi:hypothetical protein